MFDEDDNPLAQAHRVSSAAQEASARGQWQRAVELHKQAAEAFDHCAPLAEDKQFRDVFDLLVADHTASALSITRALAIAQSRIDAPTAASQQRVAHFSPAPSSHRSIGATATSTAASPTQFQHQQLQQPSSQLQALTPSQSSALVIHLAQLLQVFLLSPTAVMSYAQLQTTLSELLQLARQLSTHARQAAVPAAQLSPAEEERLGLELRKKLHVAEQLHQWLASLELSGDGMNATQLATFHAQFIELQQQQFSITRNELVLQHQSRHVQRSVEESSELLQRKLAELETMLTTAAKQVGGSTGAQTLPPAPVLQQAAVAAPTPPAPSSSSDAQVSQLQEEKRALERQLAALQRQVASERSTRLKAEKQIEKHEQRWRVLNEKVAAKKAQSAAAATAAGTTVPADGGNGSGSSSGTNGPASGSLAKPSTLAQSGRSLSASSTPAPSLHVARPVQLR